MKLLHLSIACAILGGALFVNSNATQAINEFKTKRDALFKNGAAKADDYNKLIEESLAKINIGELTAEEGAMFFQSGLGMNQKATGPLVTRMEAVSKGGGLDGALADAVILNALRTAGADAQKQRAAVAERILGSASFEQLLKSPHGSLAVQGLAQARIPAGPYSAKILGIAKLLPSASIEFAEALPSYWAMVKTHESDPAKQEAIRQQIVGFMREAAGKGKAAGKDEGWVSYVSGAAERLDGAAARGKLIGYKAPSMQLLWSSNPAIKSLDDLKGKVVVLDFWATWCGPCVGSFPNVKELQAHYKGYPVEIVGVTSIQGNIIGLEKDVIDTKGDPDKEFRLMKDYMKAKDITWNVVFSKEDVFNPQYGVNGIPHVTIIDPAGNVRHNGLHPAAPKADKTKLIDALLKEFNLKAPAK